MDDQLLAVEETEHARRMFAVFAGQTEGAFTAAGGDRKRFATDYAAELSPFKRQLAFMIADGLHAEAEQRFVEQRLGAYPKAA